MMYYLVGEHANVERRIVTEEHPVVQMHLKDTNRNWDAEKIIKWMWGIEKKSDNVYDLIEEGDLVQWGDMKDIMKVNNRDDIFCKSVFKTFKNDKLITAIYKPNSKGDYIKVWERESE